MSASVRREHQSAREPSGRLPDPKFQFREHRESAVRESQYRSKPNYGRPPPERVRAERRKQLLPSPAPPPTKAATHFYAIPVLGRRSAAYPSGTRPPRQ